MEGDVVGYFVYRDEGGVFDASSIPLVPKPILDLGSSPAAFTDWAVSQNTTYYYALKAVDASNNLSGFSIVHSATTGDSVPPPTPAWIVAEKTLNAYELAVSWETVPEADVVGYNVWERIAGSPTWDLRPESPVAQAALLRSGLTLDTYEYM